MFSKIWLCSLKKCNYVFKDMVVFHKEEFYSKQMHWTITKGNTCVPQWTWLCSLVCALPWEQFNTFVQAENISWRKIIMFFDDHLYFFKEHCCIYHGKNISLRHTSIFLKEHKHFLKNMVPKGTRPFSKTIVFS